MYLKNFRTKGRRKQQIFNKRKKMFLNCAQKQYLITCECFANKFV